MTRLEIIEKLHDLEITKTQLENLLHDIDDRYCNGVEIYGVLDTNMFADKRKYFATDKIKVNKIRLIGYLKEEINGINVEISGLINKLS